MKKEFLDRHARAEHLEKICEMPLPKWLEEIVSSEVLIQISPRILPFSHIDLREFAEFLGEQYRLKIQFPSDFGKFPGSSSPSYSDPYGALEQMMIGDEFTLRFRGGRIPQQHEGVVGIDEVRISRESIFVKVSGRSEFAESVVADIAELLWQYSGVTKGWPEISKHIQLLTYGVGTKVDLGMPFESVLSKQLLGFVHSKMLNGEGFVRDMGSLDARLGFEPPKEVVSAFSVDELHLLFNRFDQRTGRNETSRLRIGVTARSEQGTGVVLIASTMPFDRHCEMIDQLRETLNS